MTSKSLNTSTSAADNAQTQDVPAQLPRLLTENLSRNVCVCYDVPKKDIIEAFHRGAKTVEAISNQTYACQGSGCCKLQVERLVEVLNAHDLSEPLSEPSEPSATSQSADTSKSEQACSDSAN